MLEYTPVHLAYGRPFHQIADLEPDSRVDVSADTMILPKEEGMEFNLRLDLSQMLMANLIVNFILMLMLIRK
tara:strand:+ start:118 stop:333 length:216 start_codon:yes stop_codon:yes gene_type:complete